MSSKQYRIDIIFQHQGKPSLSTAMILDEDHTMREIAEAVIDAIREQENKSFRKKYNLQIGPIEEIRIHSRALNTYLKPDNQQIKDVLKSIISDQFTVHNSSESDFSTSQGLFPNVVDSNPKQKQQLKQQQPPQLQQQPQQQQKNEQKQNLLDNNDFYSNSLKKLKQEDENLKLQYKYQEKKGSIMISQNSSLSQLYLQLNGLLQFNIGSVKMYLGSKDLSKLNQGLTLEKAGIKQESLIELKEEEYQQGVAQQQIPEQKKLDLQEPPQQYLLLDSDSKIALIESLLIEFKELSREEVISIINEGVKDYPSLHQKLNQIIDSNNKKKEAEKQQLKQTQLKQQVIKQVFEPGKISLLVEIIDGKRQKELYFVQQPESTLEDLANLVLQYESLDPQFAAIDLYLFDQLYNSKIKRVKTLKDLQLKDGQTVQAKIRWIGGLGN